MDDRTERVRNLYLANRSAREISRLLSLPRSSVRRIIDRIEDGKAFTPAPLPEGHSLAKTTVQYDSDGNPVQEWRRVFPTQREIEEFVEGLKEDVKGLGKIRLPAPKNVDDKLMIELPIFDAHIGKYAWDKECGADQSWSTSSGVALYEKGVSEILARCPSAARAVVCFGGDFYHSDTRSNQTEASGHSLDVDTRFSNNIRKGAHLAKRVIALALQKAAEVDVVVLRGNHDYHSSNWLQIVLGAFYETNQRVRVLEDPSPRSYVRFGRCLLGLSHGDKVKSKDLPSIMAVERPELWSQCPFRAFHLGHVHKSNAIHPVSIDTHVGCVVEYLPSLTSTDAWHSEMGYVNPLRVIEAFLWHADYGQWARLTLPYSALKG